MTRIALATCAGYPDLHTSDLLIAEALRERGAEPVPAVWDDPAVDWAGFDAVFVRSTWDFHRKPDEFLAWAEQVERQCPLHNPSAVLRWGIDKHHLADLAAAGVPVVPTVFLEPGEQYAGQHLDVPHVVKPAVSAAALDTAALAAGDEPATRDLIARIHASGRTAMIQPYVASVEEHGETDLVLLRGKYSHAGHKPGLLSVGAAPMDFADGVKVPPTTASTARGDQIALAEAVAAHVPGGAPLYGRVDMTDVDGVPTVMEVEFVEPTLFVMQQPEVAGPIADAFLAVL